MFVRVCFTEWVVLIDKKKTPKSICFCCSCSFYVYNVKGVKYMNICCCGRCYSCYPMKFQNKKRFPNRVYLCYAY